ncbi:hypothetical protein KAI58_01600 [Candidatus Gracilibacteria bacterium]|nr:hypothetical protein [Candidatus Gracilibacteria bacterium]
MKYAEIIYEAWDLTTENTKLKWFVFVPSFVAVLVFVLEISWQLYLYLGEFGLIESEFSFEGIGALFHFLLDKNLLGWAIFGVIFILFFAFVVPSWVLGGLILGVKQKLYTPEKYLSLRQKMIEGVEYFFSLFEFSAVSGIFSLWSIAIFLATFYRYFHDTFFRLLWPVLLVYTIIAFFITVFMSFAPYFIVCEKKTLSTAIKKSVSIVFLNFGKTMSIILLMFLVNFRILINVVIILGVPLGVLLAMTYFANSVATVLSVLVGIALLGFAAYLTAIVEVFSTAVWTRTFFEMREQQKKLEDESIN